MSNITLNIVEPGSAPVVPDTGLFTAGIGGPEATIITAVSTVLLLTIVAVVVAMLYKKHKKQGKTTKLVSTVDACATVVKSKKRVSAGLAAIALLVSAGTFAALLVNAGKSNTNAAEGGDSSLTVDVSSEDLTIEVGNEPVFAVLPVELTVEEATQAGYTLTAYTDSTDLVSTTDPSNIIPMVTLPEPLAPNEEGVGRGWGPVTKLTDNTYGLALGEEPTSKDAEAYTSLSTDSLNPTIIKSMTEYTPTPANDTTTIYYGFYITPDIPYGTYTNDGEVYYNATINTTLVTFDGKGLYFDEEQTQSTNTVEYVAVPEEGKEYTVNQIISGEYKTPSQSLPYRFLGWSIDPEATEPTYTSEDDIAEHLPILPNTPLTLYAVWQKATTITFDNNGGAGTMDTQTIIAGESANLYPNTFTRDGYTFNGWNTRADGEGKSYADEELYQAEAESANVTLFAQWKKNLPSMQDVATWGSTLAQGNEITVVDSRDGTEYTVARLADNNIWMTQNLDFDIVDGGTGLDSSNTDVPDDWDDAGKLANTYTTGATTWNSSSTEPESYDPGDLYWDGTLNTSWSGNLSNETVTDPPATGGTHYHIGNYYNWTAAVAMSNSTSYTSDGTDVNQSICPAGWRLPNNSDNKSYQNLVSRQSLTAGTSGNIQNSPTYFVYGGYWEGSSSNVGSGGYYWSSVVEGSNDAYQLGFGVNGYLGPQDYGYRGVGYSLRCVAR